MNDDILILALVTRETNKFMSQSSKFKHLFIYLIFCFTSLFILHISLIKKSCVVITLSNFNIYGLLNSKFLLFHRF